MNDRMMLEIRHFSKSYGGGKNIMVPGIRTTPFEKCVNMV